MKKIRTIPAKSHKGNDTLNKETKLKVCAYCRVSTGSSKQAESFETQISYYERYIKNNPKWEFVGIYADKGISGTTAARRTEFNRMIKDCEKGNIDLIITKSISRFAKNTADCLEVVRFLRSLNVGVYFERENINTLGAESELILSVLNSIAQDESRNMSENIKWAIQKRFKEGKVNVATKRFLGYDLNDEGELVINPQEAEIVRRIYREYLDGKSMNEIKNGLDRDGIKTITGKEKWQENTIKVILSNEKYYGDALLQKTVTLDYLTHKRKRNDGESPKYLVKNHHEPIISKEEFDRVQEIMADRAAKYGNIPEVRHKYNKRYAFSGKIICGNCTGVFKRRTWNSKSPSRQIVWQCSTYIKEGKDACSMKAVDDMTLKAVFVRAFNRFYANREQFLSIFMKNVEKGFENKNTENSEVQRQIQNIAEDIKKLIRLQIEGKISTEDYEKNYMELKKQLDKLKKTQSDNSAYKKKQPRVTALNE
ncbi:Site-specific DNA recombinase [Caminicella sporogenes DSM 14501]|uniref:Site-specific DNA recombinase n=1 Tax=Caminicella sporogenes DSM 14501 TaxID=1121266 RepID=A0A1M6RFB4_9FIRM|nr:recombinase family protein [Caminicella sporogenes]SHK31068.1 Site-specific DNA recombinase [Caminicella sporogenes DSM 14501]